MFKLKAENLASVLRELNILSRIRMVLFDDQGNELVSYPDGRAPLCERIRSHPEGYEKCKACDRKAFRKCRCMDEPLIYTCDAGMTEAIIPLKQNDVLLGYLMFGQVICGQHEGQDRQRLRDMIQAQDFMINEDMTLIQSVSWKTPDEIQACATLLKLLTVYTLSTKLLYLPSAAFADRLSQFIDYHLTESISIAMLCRFFGVSRSTLYQLSAEKLGVPLSEYIQRYRIRKACELLEETSYTIGHIAAFVGFSDQNHFSRIFRKCTGLTAREYRKKHLEKLPAASRYDEY